MARAISVDQLLRTKFRVMPFEGEWQNLLGNPELSGSWIVWGNPGNGKTRFMLQLCKYLCRFVRVGYNSLEEGNSESLKKAVRESNMMEVRKRFILIDKEPYNELVERLEKQKSPDVICIDSLQYFEINYERYKWLKEKFPKKLFIYISHAEGQHPEGRIAKKIRYDASVKIFVQNFQAQAASRYGGGKPYIIWEEGYERSNAKCI